MNIDMNIELHEYVLFENGKNTGVVTKLGMFEAQKINYAYGLNRVTKRYVLKSEVNVAKSNDASVLLLPKD